MSPVSINQQDDSSSDQSSSSESSTKSQESSRKSAFGRRRSTRETSSASHRTNSKSPTGSVKSNESSGSHRKSSSESDSDSQNEDNEKVTRSRSVSPSHLPSQNEIAEDVSREVRSRSRSPSSSPYKTQHSRSRSGSCNSEYDKKTIPADSKSSNLDSYRRSRSRSRSKSGSYEKSLSGSPPKSRSHSRSKSRSPIDRRKFKKSNSVALSERSHSESPQSQQSRSPSGDRSKKSRSRTPEQINDHDDDDSMNGVETIKKSKVKKVIGFDSDDSDAQSGNEKTKRHISSEEESEIDNKSEKVTADALFGDADDISSEDEVEKQSKRAIEIRKDSLDEEGTPFNEDGQEEHPKIFEDRGRENKEEEDETTVETRIDVEIPKISCDLGKEIHFVKLPNFLSVDTRPFSAETYEDEIDEEETLDEEGRARLKLKVENTIRWREVLDKEGNVVKESNAKFVRWSDGSLSLHLGGEIFDVYKQPLQNDHNHLFIRQGTGLQGQAVFRTKLSFRPHSTESFTHRKMTLSLAERSHKTSGIKVLSQVGHDPDARRDEMIKKEEEKLRASLRRESKARRVRERGGTRSINTSYLEQDGSDEEGISLNAIKSKIKSKSAEMARRNIYTSSEEESDVETVQRSKRHGRLQDTDEESGEDAIEDEEDGEKDDEGQTSKGVASGSDGERSE